jgi:hypothetical protein
MTAPELLSHYNVARSAVSAPNREEIDMAAIDIACIASALFLTFAIAVSICGARR